MSGFNLPPGVSARDIPGQDDRDPDEGDMQAIAVMTLRDVFAAAVLNSITAGVMWRKHTPDTGDDVRSGIAHDAYAMADAMLKARLK